jgi:hypothetical protein
MEPYLMNIGSTITQTITSVTSRSSDEINKDLRAALVALAGYLYRHHLRTSLAAFVHTIWSTISNGDIMTGPQPLLLCLIDVCTLLLHSGLIQF